AIGRIDDRLPTPRKAVAVGVAGMELPYGGYGETGGLVGAGGVGRGETDGRGEVAKNDGKTRGGKLGVESPTLHVVAAVNANAVAGNISGRKKRGSHNVVPVRVRQEYIEAVLASRAMFPQHVAAEFAHAGTEVADHIFVGAGNDLDTAGIAAKSAAY